MFNCFKSNQYVFIWIVFMREDNINKQWLSACRSTADLPVNIVIVIPVQLSFFSLYVLEGRTIYEKNLYKGIKKSFVCICLILLKSIKCKMTNIWFSWSISAYFSEFLFTFLWLCIASKRKKIIKKPSIC